MSTDASQKSFCCSLNISFTKHHQLSECHFYLLGLPHPLVNSILSMCIGLLLSFIIFIIGRTKDEVSTLSNTFLSHINSSISSSLFPNLPSSSLFNSSS